MAYIITEDKKYSVDAETGKKIWELLIGVNKNASTEIEAQAIKVKKIYLNWRKAPDSYLIAKKALILPMLIDTFVVDAKGKPLHPAPTDKIAWRISYFYGIIPK